MENWKWKGQAADFTNDLNTKGQYISTPQLGSHTNIILQEIYTGEELKSAQEGNQD